MFRACQGRYLWADKDAWGREVLSVTDSGVAWVQKENGHPLGSISPEARASHEMGQQAILPVTSRFFTNMDTIETSQPGAKSTRGAQGTGS